jgi:uncharacterized membrane protein
MHANGHMIWMTISWFVELAMIIAVLWLLFSAFRSSSGTSETAEEILRRRLASGEIDIEEYERRLAALSRTKRAA